MDLESSPVSPLSRRLGTWAEVREMCIPQIRVALAACDRRDAALARQQLNVVHADTRKPRADPAGMGRYCRCKPTVGWPKHFRLTLIFPLYRHINACHLIFVIQGFGNEITVRIWNDETPKSLPLAIVKKTFQKLQLLDAAKQITDLFFPRSNGLHKLGGNLNGYYAIKVNDKWRIIFTWSQAGPANVKLVDYH